MIKDKILRNSLSGIILDLSKLSKKLSKSISIYWFIKVPNLFGDSTAFCHDFQVVDECDVSN